MANKHFLQARSFLRVFSDSELLLPLEHYAASFKNGQLAAHDIAAAIEEIHWPTSVKPMTSEQVVESLLRTNVTEVKTDAKTGQFNHLRQLKTVAESLSNKRIDWLELIQDEITKHCSAYFDEGQASWAYPWKQISLYQAWRTSAHGI